MTFDFFYMSGSLVIPPVDHLNMNKPILYYNMGPGVAQWLRHCAQFIFSINSQTPLHVSGISIAHHQEAHRMDTTVGTCDDIFVNCNWVVTRWQQYSTVHIYTQTVHRTIQNKQYIEQHNNFGRVRTVLRLG